MIPELPVEIAQDAQVLEIIDPLPCAMLRFGLSCGSDAYHILITPMDNSCYRLMPFCQMCADDISNVWRPKKPIVIRSRQKVVL